MNVKYNWPYFDKDEINSVVNVLKSGKVNYWTGKECKLFEKKFSKYIGTKYALSLSNGTIALECCLESLGLNKGDEVIVPSRTYVATGLAVDRVGLKPIFSDIDLVSGNISLKEIKKVITKKTKAIICVHLAGWPCNMSEIMNFAKRESLFVIEDCAQAHGSVYENKKVGSLGHLAAWSFCNDKIISTAGEGGMITTNYYKFFNKIRSLRDHGKNINKLKNNKKNEFKWLVENNGSNYRLTESQAAIGIIQLSKLDLWIKKRNQNAKKLTKIFNKSKLFYTNILNNHYFEKSLNENRSIHAYYKFYVYLQNDNLISKKFKSYIVEVFNNFGIKCFYGSCPEIYMEKVFKNNLVRKVNAKILGNRSLMFDCHQNLNKEYFINIAKALKFIESEI